MFYKIKKNFSFDISEISESLEEFRFKLCLPESGSSIGFVGPFGDSELCCKLNGGGFLMKVRYQEKIIAKSEVSRLLIEKAGDIEEGEGRLVRGRERLELKHKIIEEMRKTAQSRFKESSIIVIPRLELLCVLNASPSLADDVTFLLRKAIGNLPIVLAETKHVLLKALYTRTVIAPCFELTDKIKLHNAISDSKAMFDSCDWHSGVDELINSGFRITEIGVHLRGFFSFSLGENGRPSKIQWDEEITAKSNIEYESPPIKEGEDYDEDRAKREQDISIAIADAYLVQLGIETYVSEFIGLFGGFKEFTGNEKVDGTEGGAVNDATN